MWEVARVAGVRRLMISWMCLLLGAGRVGSCVWEGGLTVFVQHGVTCSGGNKIPLAEGRVRKRLK